MIDKMQNHTNPDGKYKVDVRKFIEAESEGKELYKSPIEKIYGEIQTQMMQEDENMVMKAIRKVGVNVDKEELIKALQYDRNQYAKGYEDGKNDVLDKIRAEIEQQERWLMDAGYNAYNVDIAFGSIKLVVDKCKAETEEI